MWFIDLVKWVIGSARVWVTDGGREWDRDSHEGLECSGWSTGSWAVAGVQSHDRKDARIRRFGRRISHSTAPIWFYSILLLPKPLWKPCFSKEPVQPLQGKGGSIRFCPHFASHPFLLSRYINLTEERANSNLTKYRSSGSRTSNKRDCKIIFHISVWLSHAHNFLCVWCNFVFKLYGTSNKFIPKKTRHAF